MRHWDLALLRTVGIWNKTNNPHAIGTNNPRSRQRTPTCKAVSVYAFMRADVVVGGYVCMHVFVLAYVCYTRMCITERRTISSAISKVGVRCPAAPDTFGCVQTPTSESDVQQPDSSFCGRRSVFADSGLVWDEIEGCGTGERGI